MNADDILNGVKGTLTSPQVKAVAAMSAIGFAALGVFMWSWSTSGPFATIIYSFLFVACLVLCPVAIALLAHTTPNAVGKLHMVLGAVAFDHHYLVQREHGWEWCPGDRGRVWIDEGWHDIDGGHENYSVLCWRPFGVLRYKDDDTWARERVDGEAERGRPDFERDPSITTDGGATGVERGAITEADRPNITGQKGTWMLDLKRVYSRGVEKIGDIELIETAEEVIERGQLAESGMSGMPGWAQTIIGLVIGLAAGFGYVLLS